MLTSIKSSYFTIHKCHPFGIRFMRNYLCCIDPLQFFDDIHFETCRPGRTAALRAGNLPTASPLGRLDGRDRNLNGPSQQKYHAIVNSGSLSPQPDSESARASAASRVTHRVRLPVPPAFKLNLKAGGAVGPRPGLCPTQAWAAECDRTVTVRVRVAGNRHSFSSLWKRCRLILFAKEISRAPGTKICISNLIVTKFKIGMTRKLSEPQQPLVALVKRVILKSSVCVDRHQGTQYLVLWGSRSQNNIRILIG